MENVYTSAKESFLDFALWVKANGTPEEIELHSTQPGTEAWETLYKKWVTAEQINGHKLIVDGVETVLEPPVGE